VAVLAMVIDPTSLRAARSRSRRRFSAGDASAVGLVDERDDVGSGLGGDDGVGDDHGPLCQAG